MSSKKTADVSKSQDSNNSKKTSLSPSLDIVKGLSNLPTSLSPSLDIVKGLSNLSTSLSLSPSLDVAKGLADLSTSLSLSPSLDVAKGLANLSTSLSLSPSLDGVANSIISMFPNFEMIKGLAAATSLLPDFKVLQNITATRRILPDLSVITENSQLDLFPEISTINNLIKKSNSLVTYNDAITIDLGMDVDFADEQNVLEITKRIEKNFIEVIKDKLSLEFYLNFILTLALFTYGQKSSEQGKNEIINTIENSEEKITKEIHQIKNNTTNYTYYVIIRQTFGYNYPSIKKSNIRILLYPNQKIRLVSKRSKWIYVEYFNHLRNRHEQAWCMKKYLKLIKRP